MPVVLREAGFKFMFYSNEGSPREPVHIHVRQGRDEAKFWLQPAVQLAYNDGLTARDLNRAQRLVEDRRGQFERLGMSTSPRAIRFDEDCLWVDLEDGRTVGVPLAWFPRLLHATPAQRDIYELSRRGIHWDALDEDISVGGLLAGQGDMTRPRPVAA